MAKKRFIKLGIILSSITGATILLGAGVNLLNSSTGISHSLRATQVQIPENAKKFDSIVIQQSEKIGITRLASYYYNHNFLTENDVISGEKNVSLRLEQYMKKYVDSLKQNGSGTGTPSTSTYVTDTAPGASENTGNSGSNPTNPKNLSIEKMIAIGNVKQELEQKIEYKEVYDKLSQLVQDNKATFGDLQADSATGIFYAVVQINNANSLGKYRKQEHPFPAFWHLTDQWVQQLDTTNHAGIWNDIANPSITSPQPPASGNTQVGQGSTEETSPQTRATENNSGSTDSGNGSVEGSIGNAGGGSGSGSNTAPTVPAEPAKKESNKSWYLIKFESYARTYDINKLQIDLSEGSTQRIFFERKAFSGYDSYTQNSGGGLPSDNDSNKLTLGYDSKDIRTKLNVTDQIVDISMTTPYDAVLTNWNNTTNKYDRVANGKLPETIQNDLLKFLEIVTKSSITTKGAITYSATGNQITFHVPVWNVVSPDMNIAEVDKQRLFVEKNYSITATLVQTPSGNTTEQANRFLNRVANATETKVVLNRSTDGSVAPVTVNIPVSISEESQKIEIGNEYAIKKTITFDASGITNAEHKRIINEALFDTNPNLSKIYAKIRTDFRTEILKQVKTAVGPNYVELPSDNTFNSISFAVKTGQTVTPETKPDQGTDQGGGSTGQGETGKPGTGGGDGTIKPGPQEPTNPETQLPPTDNPGTDGQTGGTVDKPQTDNGSGNQENIQQDNSNPSINNNSTTTENASNAGLITGISVSIAAIVVLSGFIGMNFYKKGSHRTSSETNTVESLPIEDKPADPTASKEIK